MPEVHFVNVGYGDAALVLQREPEGQSFVLLIDCGSETVGDDDPSGARITAADYLKAQGVEYIDIVLLSHLHLDHCGGILAIAKGFTVGELWTSYVPQPSLLEGSIPIGEALEAGPANLARSLGIYAGALQILGAKHTAIHPITAGFTRSTPVGELRIIAGDPALYARQDEILDDVLLHGGTNGPLKELDGFLNDTSLRAQISLSGTTFLFAGDISAGKWEEEDISPADVVKIPHHGHADALNAAIISRLQPQYAVISVSNTREDRCPHPQTIRLLEESGARVLFTDSMKPVPGPQGEEHRSIIFHVGTRDRSC